MTATIEYYKAHPVYGGHFAPYAGHSDIPVLDRYSDENCQLYWIFWLQRHLMRFCQAVGPGIEYLHSPRSDYPYTASSFARNQTLQPTWLIGFAFRGAKETDQREVLSETHTQLFFQPLDLESAYLRTHVHEVMDNNVLYPSPDLYDELGALTAKNLYTSGTDFTTAAYTSSEGTRTPQSSAEYAQEVDREDYSLPAELNANSDTFQSSFTRNNVYVIYSLDPGKEFIHFSLPYRSANQSIQFLSIDRLQNIQPYFYNNVDSGLGWFVRLGGDPYGSDYQHFNIFIPDTLGVTIPLKREDDQSRRVASFHGMDCLNNQKLTGSQSSGSFSRPQFGSNGRAEMGIPYGSGIPYYSKSGRPHFDLGSNTLDRRALNPEMYQNEAGYEINSWLPGDQFRYKGNLYMATDAQLAVRIG